MVDNIQKLSFIQQMHNFIRTKVADGINNVPKQMPGHVSEILPNDFLKFTIDATGPYTMPVLTVPQAFSKYSREPTSVGDRGYILSSALNLGGESGNDGSTANMYPRGNLTTGTFHPISNKDFPKRDPNQFLVTGGKSGHKTQSSDTKTSSTIDNGGSGKIDHIADKGITQKATSGDIASSATTGNMTQAAPNGVLNLVQNSLNIGKAGDPNAFPPVPSLPTIMNVIGSLSSTGNSSSSGTMSAAGGFVGAAGGSSANSGIVGEVILNNITNPLNLPYEISTNVGNIILTPGDWDVFGEIWFTMTDGYYTGLQAGISIVSNTLPTVSSINQAQTSINAVYVSGTTQILPIRACRANVTVNTIYYLVAYATYAYNTWTGTVTGNIWARRAR